MGRLRGEKGVSESREPIGTADAYAGEETKFQGDVLGASVSPCNRTKHMIVLASAAVTQHL
jgi:hypothetical protein